MTTRRRAALLGVLVAAALAFRIAVVSSYQAPGGSGAFYQDLATELRRNGRYAGGPPPAPLTYTRLPGYPLFLAYLVYPKVPNNLATHLKWATRANAVLDVGTALLVLLLLVRAGFGLLAGVLGFACVIVSPMMVYLSTFGLVESLATFLYTLAIYCMVRAMRERPVLHAALAGVAVGMGQLVRVDTVLLVGAAGLALLLAAGPLRTRAKAFAAFAAAALVVFAPWPLRNYARFKKFHATGSYYLSVRGNPLPSGIMSWMNTWASGLDGEMFISYVVEYETNLDKNHPRMVIPSMWDSEQEKQRVFNLYALWNKDHFAPAVDRAFRALAAERAHREPFRTYVRFPLRRLKVLWSPMPVHELPVKSKVLHLPEWRDHYKYLEWFLFACAAAGAVALARRGPFERRLLLLLLAVVATRSLLFVYVHFMPFQRYVVEVIPSLMALAGCGLAWPLRRAPAARPS